jgi:transposase
MENKKISFKNILIYIGIDVHLWCWKVCILTEEFEHKVFNSPTSAKSLSNYLRKNFPEGDYYSVYEAGYSGYWIHEELEQYGIENIIVNPADIPTKDKEKRVKTDSIDCRKLARCLMNGELDPIRIRTKEQQQDRALVRMRHKMIKKQTICKNQIKSLLAFYGIYIDESKVQAYWSRKYIESVENYTRNKGSATKAFNSLLRELKDLRSNILEITKEIRILSRTERYEQNVRLLESIPGISMLSAITILTEIGDIRNFGTLDKLTGYIGLVPGEHSSGERENKSRMLRRGNKILKCIIVESSWIAVRKDPSLMLVYKNLIQRQKKTRAIIKIAKKLINRIRYVLMNGNEYKLLVA